MAIYNDSASLETFLQKAQSVSQHLIMVTVEGNYKSDTSLQEDASAPEPMQTDGYHLATGERQRQFLQGLPVPWRARSFCSHLSSPAPKPSGEYALFKYCNV